MYISGVREIETFASWIMHHGSHTILRRGYLFSSHTEQQYLWGSQSVNVVDERKELRRAAGGKWIMATTTETVACCGPISLRIQIYYLENSLPLDARQ